MGQRRLVMTTLTVRRSLVEAAGSDPSWRSLYRAGGVSGLLAGLIYIVAAVLIFTTPSPPASGGVETLQYIASHRSLYILKQVLWLGPSVLAMVMFLALYPALRHVNKSYAAIGTVLGIMAWGLSLAWPTTGEGSPILVYLSDHYSAATSDAARTAFATAAEVLVATEGTPAAIGVLQTISILVISIVMVRGGFPRSVAYLGVATGAIGVLSESLIELLGGLYAIYGVLLMIWFLAVGWQLYRLARKEPPHL
jgi:hypothetical protein